jgi:hypothetical protein
MANRLKWVWQITDQRNNTRYLTVREHGETTLMSDGRNGHALSLSYITEEPVVLAIRLEQAASLEEAQGYLERHCPHMTIEVFH